MDQIGKRLDWNIAIQHGIAVYSTIKIIVGWVMLINLKDIITRNKFQGKVNNDMIYL